MRYFLIPAAALGVALLASAGANAQQGRQATGDQESFKQSVKALPSTHKRRQIIRSELSTKNSRLHRTTTGMAPR